MVGTNEYSYLDRNKRVNSSEDFSFPGGISKTAKLILDGATIQNNEGTYGGGLTVFGNGDAVMKSGVIASNKAHNGAGVFIWDYHTSGMSEKSRARVDIDEWAKYIPASFEMSGGTIRDNIARKTLNESNNFCATLGDLPEQIGGISFYEMLKQGKLFFREVGDKYTPIISHQRGDDYVKLIPDGKEEIERTIQQYELLVHNPKPFEPHESPEPNEPPEPHEPPVPYKPNKPSIPGKSTPPPIMVKAAMLLPKTGAVYEGGMIQPAPEWI